MDIDVYQKRALETKFYPDNFKVIYPTLGLVGEAGEVAEKVKKIIRDGNGIASMTQDQKMHLAFEISDVCWYLAALSDDLGLKLSEIFQMNIAKLADRATRGKLGGSGSNR